MFILYELAYFLLQNTKDDILKTFLLVKGKCFRLHPNHNRMNLWIVLNKTPNVTEYCIVLETLSIWSDAASVPPTEKTDFVYTDFMWF